MRFIHLADLHIGKRVNEFSMLEDQRYIFEQVLEMIDGLQQQRIVLEAMDEQNHIVEQIGRQNTVVDGVLIAGDLYDKPVPSAEAVQLFDWFLTQLADRKLPVYMVSGNHDSAERLSFGAHLLKKSGVFLSSIYDGALAPIVLEDEEGPLNLYLLPFLKPAYVKHALGAEAEQVVSYQDAMELVVKRLNPDPAMRNVLVAHQMVTGASRCESEEVSIGGLDNIDAEVFDAFDYVALGHLHGPQRVGRTEVRYSGTLLKYSFSECRHHKSVTVVDLGKKGDVRIHTIPVRPLHDMRQIEGTYETVMSRDFYKDMNREDYLKVILTDEEEIVDGLGRLRTVYPNIMKLEYNNTRTKNAGLIENVAAGEKKSPFDYVQEFYEKQNRQEMSQEQKEQMQELVEQIWG